ncbi:hypothetical protein ACHHYP_16819 [Achlya hypogyna]|uniref:Uncharacterized protein n=1 Tax=Achlya hypogyna TaxID=1202772 RepID=A0A1V9Y5S1_ACHHY|nr:hypothetical protein ACHHYP_16819 [Achlya hypogyna]
MGTWWSAPLPAAETLDSIEATGTDGEMLLSRVLVHNSRMMVDLNPILATGIAHTTVTGTFATTRRTLPAWTSVHVLVRHKGSMHVIVASADAIELCALPEHIARLGYGPKNKWAVRRLGAVPAQQMEALRAFVADLAVHSPLLWRDAAVLPASSTAVLSRAIALLRRSVATITPVEEDILRYAFCHQDAECLGWLYVEDLPKLAETIEAAGIFHPDVPWVDCVRALLPLDGDSPRFTAADLVAAARQVPRRHFSAEHDVGLYLSAAVAASVYEHAQLLAPEQQLATGVPRPLVPVAFAALWAAAPSGSALHRVHSDEALTWLQPELWRDEVPLRPPL